MEDEERSYKIANLAFIAADYCRNYAETIGESLRFIVSTELIVTDDGAFLRTIFQGNRAEGYAINVPL